MQSHHPIHSANLVRWMCLGLIIHFSVVEGSVAAADPSPPSIAPRFLYDPVTEQSRPHPVPRRVTGDAPTLAIDFLPASSSFTIQAFARPDAVLQTQPRDFLPVIRLSGGEHAVEIGVYRNPPPHSYNWWACRVVVPDQRPLELARRKYRGASMIEENSPWRHLAVVGDRHAGTISYYLDYQLQARIEWPAEFDAPLTDLSIGSGAAGQTFPGVIGEYQIDQRALPAGKFLRQTDVELTGVSFSPEAEPKLPADYGHIDVRLHYGAIGDGIHDDTAAIQRAFRENMNRVPVEYRTVYFPAGTYRISDTIQFSRFMVVRGAGREQTRIQLVDNAPGFADPAVPKPTFAVGYDWPSVNRTRRQRAGNVIGNYIFDLSIDTGRGNPAALGLDFHCNNVGGVENVTIRSGDGSGLAGLDLRRGWPGPCLIKNVSIEGFDIGIAAAHREYSLVFSGIDLRAQRRVGVQNLGNVLSIENLHSENRVPAIENRAGGLVVLLTSTLSGGASDQTAISSENASLYLRDVNIAGYPHSLLETRVAQDDVQTTLAASDERTIREYSTGPEVGLFPHEAAGSLKLPIKTTPVVPFPAISGWVNVTDFRGLINQGDWAPAIQAAIDSGAELVYFPDDERYRIGRRVIVRGQVRTLLGGSPKTRVDVIEPAAASGASFTFAEDLPMCQFHMLNPAAVQHDTPTTLIFRHCTVNELNAGPHCGELFIEDAGESFASTRINVFGARQLNPETKNEPEIINSGGQLWILGMKTEYLSTKLVNGRDARTELLGGLMYPVHPVHDETLPMFINDGGSLSLIHAVSVYKKNHKIYLRETHGDQTREYTDWHWVNGRPLMNLYRSEPPVAR